jgi:hypothetical protein
MAYMSIKIIEQRIKTKEKQVNFVTYFNCIVVFIFNLGYIYNGVYGLEGYDINHIILRS